MSQPAPLFRLKRQARLLSRHEGIPLHAALDRIAADQGYRSWSLLAARRQRQPGSPGELYRRLVPGDMVLLGARPGEGKTLMGLRLAVEAVKAGRGSAFFSLEYVERHLLDRFRAIGVDPGQLGSSFLFDCSDDIASDHIIARLAHAPAGTLAVVDYLQILDQKRDKPDLTTQLRDLGRFAKTRGVTLVFLSQIDRCYDPAVKSLPDLGDVRQPNPVDLSVFDKACFLNAGRIGFATGSATA